ncbi:MAG TPA: zf-HC2 domain-containing protein [Candidatus Dormibacteraeota bacterium]|jgi:hypothetical protein
MVTEPSLEELSAYVDGELDASARAQLDAHLATCAECRARIEGLRLTVNAVRALPMETPPRTFTVPLQRRQSWSWAPVGWLGGAAAALLVVALGLSQFHGLGGGSANSSSGTTAMNHAAAPVQGGLAAPGSSPADKRAYALVENGFPNHADVTDPTDGTRQLSIGADSAAYPSNGALKVSVVLQGSPSSSINVSDQGLKLVLMRNGYGVALPDPVGISSYNGTPVFGATYKLGSLPLAQPRAGDYLLVATWVIPDGSGHVLQAGIPIRLTGN